MGAVQYERAEPVVYYIVGGTAFQVANPLPRGREFGDTSGKAWPMEKGCSPERGNIAVEFDEYRPLGQMLHDRGKRHDAPAREWFDEHLWACFG